nr:hypothetical protein [Tanacetum cinerariifolium]
MFELLNVVIIGWNNVVNELPSKPCWTSAYANDHKVRVKAKQGFEAMIGIEPSYVHDSCARELEANLSKKVYLLERENMAFGRDLEWVMRKYITRILARVFRSEQFDYEMLKVKKELIERRPELGRQEASDLLVSNQ